MLLICLWQISWHECAYNFIDILLVSISAVFFSDDEQAYAEGESYLQKIVNVFETFQLKIIEQLKVSAQLVEVSIIFCTINRAESV